ncbi:MAG: DUF7224 domain-containing protein [Dermatophilaceae bacterium]
MMLRTVLRRSALGAVLLVLTAVSLAIVLAGRDRGVWAGDWRATSLQAQFPVVVLAPLLSAASAQVGGLTHRHGFWRIENTMPRPPARVALLHWVAVLAVGLTAYAVGVIVAVGITAAADSDPTTSTGGPWPSYLGLGALALAAYSAAGYAAGRLLASRWVPLAVGGAVFVWLLALSLAPDPLGRLAIVQADVFSPVDQSLTVLYVLGAAALCAVVVAVALGITRLRRNDRLALRALGLWPTCFVAAAAIVLLALPSAVEPRDPVEPRCAGATVRVCVWPEHAKWLPLLADTAARVEAALPGHRVLPPETSERGLRAEGVSFVLAGGEVTGPSAVTALVGHLLPHPPACVLADRDRIERYVLVLAWLQLAGAGSVGSDVQVDPARLQHLQALPVPEQRRWVAANVDAVAECATGLPVEQAS